MMQKNRKGNKSVLPTDHTFIGKHTYPRKQKITVYDIRFRKTVAHGSES